MRYLTSTQLRQKFLDFFEERGHQVVPSSPLIPGNDPTLLFTNAGMVPFKEVFLGLEDPGYKRAVSIQRCVRAGGKHNDLDNVGFTKRHHTFFEMMGNFSFGDYFKTDAIQMAWAFLTKVLELPEERLWITVYKDDSQAKDIWLNQIGVSEQRFSYCDADNFWAMGDTGPCGPCTEIFYDHGPELSGGPPGSPDEDGDRYVEIWNLVFMQYNRDKNGQLNPLPQPSVDTGMGLERIAAVMQNVSDNYDIDLFQYLMQQAAHQVGIEPQSTPALKVIADHIRSCAFLIVDGVRPSNEGRGYVLRRIIRRAVRHGYQLGCKKPFFYALTAALVHKMGEAYPELVQSQSIIEQVLYKEEEQFRATLHKGMGVLHEAIGDLEDNILSGETAFKLYDTYGFPLDLTMAILADHNIQVDQAGFEKAMQQQKERSKQASQFEVDYNQMPELDYATEFKGYEQLTTQATVQSIVNQGQTVTDLPTGERGAVILDYTPFYAESGGQVGDQGLIFTDSMEFIVEDAQAQGDAVVHLGYVKTGTLQMDQSVTAQVDGKLRHRTMLHHSATHLLHAALRQILGEHVVQKGSLVDPEHLRFDFSYFEAVPTDKLRAIENCVNEQIQRNLSVDIEYLDMETARQSGAICLFEEKYQGIVRVLSMGDFSKELCGGTHVQQTGQIGFFKLVSETGIAAGTRRIEAVAGPRAVEWAQQVEQQIGVLTNLLKTTPDYLTEKAQDLLEDKKQLQKDIQNLKSRLAKAQTAGNDNQEIALSDARLIIMRLEEDDVKALRQIMDEQKSKRKDAIILIIAQTSQGKVTYLIGLSNKELTHKYSAKQLINILSEVLHGKGGGRDDMAQGGSDYPEAIDSALDQLIAYLQQL